MCLLFLIRIVFILVQAEQLSEFYELCKSIHIGRGERLLKIEQVWLGIHLNLDC
jgi:hypothetical protein